MVRIRGGLERGNIPCFLHAVVARSSCSHLLEKQMGAVPLAHPGMGDGRPAIDTYVLKNMAPLVSYRLGECHILQGRTLLSISS